MAENVKPGSWFIDGWSLSIKNTELEPGPQDSSGPVVASPVEQVVTIGDRFATRLQLLWTYMSQIGAVAQATAASNTATLVILMKELQRKAKEKGNQGPLATAELRLKLKRGETARTEAISVPVYDELTLKALHEHGKYNAAATAILHETAVQQLVNAFEHLMADLVRDYLKGNPKASLKDRTITYQRLLEYQSLEEAQRWVIEDQVTEFVRNNGTKEHLDYLKNELRIDVRSSFGSVSQFLELVLRRHAIVHAGGIATTDYLRRAKEISGIGPLPAEGSLLELEPAYITSGWDVVYSMGIITLHLAGRNRARAVHDKAAEDEVDTFLNNSALWAVQQERYQAAERILNYAAKAHLAKDTCQRMVAINLAQTLKWQGKGDECRKVLDELDWHSSSSVFRLAVAVLCDETDIEKLLVSSLADSAVTAGSMYSWPLFKGLRAQADFKGLMERVFGVSAAEHDEELSVNVLNFDHRKTLAKLKQLADSGPAKRGKKEPPASPGGDGVH